MQSENVFRALFGRMGREGMTAHGFRSTFRDWASESAHAPRKVAEAALTHVVGGVEGPTPDPTSWTAAAR